MKQNVRAVSSGESQPSARVSWYVATAKVLSFTVVEIETIPTSRSENLVW